MRRLARASAPTDGSDHTGAADGSDADQRADIQGLAYSVVEQDGIRAVTQSFSREDGTTFKLQRAHKIGIAHWYEPSGRDEPIALYSGPFVLEEHGDVASYQGSVELVWRPQPSVSIAGVADNLPTAADIMRQLTPTGPTWVPPAVFLLPDPAVVPAQPGHPLRAESDEDGHPRLMTTTNVVRVGATSGFDRVTFLVPNGWEAIDGLEVGDPLDPLRSVAGGLVATNAEWEVFLHPRLDRGSDRIRTLARLGGHDVTHVGQFRRVDSAPFDDEQSFALCTTLRLCFSIATGQTTTCLLPVGWSEQSPAGARWNGAPVDSWRNVGTWLDPTIASQQMQQLIAAALAYCADPARQQLLRHAVSLYVTASYDTDVELSVAIPVSGLQMLSYTRFVEDRQQYKPNDFPKLTEKQIRKLIDDCSIDPDIPSHFTELQAASQDIANLTGQPPRDALGTIVYMRNKIIHPTNIRPDRWSPYQWAEASFVARHYLALAILNTVGYRGGQHSPLSPDRWAGAVEPVPWAP